MPNPIVLLANTRQHRASRNDSAYACRLLLLTKNIRRQHSTPNKPTLPERDPPSVKFQLIDTILEQSDDRIVAIKSVTAAEEYLQDHFPAFPVLPGVLMIETFVQAARILINARTGDPRSVLSEVRALRYGSFVKPGESLRVEVTIKSGKDGQFKCRGEGKVIRPLKPGGTSPNSEENTLETAVSGRFALRPLRSPK